MRTGFLLTLVVLASGAASHVLAQIPAAYLSPRYVAPQNAPSTVVVVDKDEPGERLIVTGQVTDGATPLAKVSVFVFHTDANGLYTTDGRNSDQDSRLRAAMWTDANGRYRYETVRPKGDGGAPAHVHYVVNAPGYKPRMFELWFDDDPLLAERRRTGVPDVPPNYPPDAVAIGRVTRDAGGIWHATRNLLMARQ